ncbi:MAG TPA: M15 family metallopeptidase [Labilithrix sp.]|nr:M15 family metallopeptidase [Labilithrix sp.]
MTAVTLLAGCGRGARADMAETGDAAQRTVVVDAGGTALDAGVDAARTGSSASADVVDPYGPARVSTRASCGVLGADHVSERDLKTSFVDGNDLLAIVNRSPTGQLAPDYAPSDLVDIRTGKPLSASECEKFQCLRREAATALDELLAQMKKAGFAGKVESAFRSYGAQCGTFGNWSRKSSFCEATEQSALPGHSQHQLGTTVDLFTEDWAKDERGVFREGFGCTDAGRYIREHATDFGFVMPYPIHPDDRHPRQKCVARWDIPVNINPRTGYRYEHWHIRYVGREAAARFQAALAASGIGTPSEITVEQWLRAEKGIAGPDAELPVCDGCNCGACSTLAPRGENGCDRKGGALHLDEHGKPVVIDPVPELASAVRGKARKWRGRVVEVKLDVPIGTLTQPPIVGLDAAGYSSGATFEKLAPYADTEPRAYPPLANAWVVAVEPIPNDTGVAWPYRAAITAAANGQIYNRANVLLPTRGGPSMLRVPIPGGVTKARVVLLQGGAARGQERVVTFEQ